MDRSQRQQISVDTYTTADQWHEARLHRVVPSLNVKLQIHCLVSPTDDEVEPHSLSHSSTHISFARIRSDELTLHTDFNDNGMLGFTS